MCVYVAALVKKRERALQPCDCDCDCDCDANIVVMLYVESSMLLVGFQTAF
jgi:hypothetical protein